MFGRVHRLAAPRGVCALAGCGSMRAAELPAPAGPPASPPLSEAPAGKVATVVAQAELTHGAGGRPRARPAQLGGRSVATGREPIAVAMLDRGDEGRRAVRARADARDLRRAARSKRSGKTGAGIGPTGLATDGVELLYVTDVDGRRAARLPPAPALRADPPRPSDRRTVRDRLRPGALGPVDRRSPAPTGSSTTPPAAGRCCARRSRRSATRARCPSCDDEVTVVERVRESGPARPQQVERARDREQRARSPAASATT